MALFKIFKGDGSAKALPETKTDGFCYFTYNDGKFYVDYLDSSGELCRSALNAAQADSAAKLTTAHEVVIQGAVDGTVASWNGSDNLVIDVVLNTEWADKITDAYAHAVTNKGSAFAEGLYKITTNAEGHVTATTEVTKSDITALGIPSTDTTYSVMSGASSSADGAAGLVPQPITGQQNHFLAGDGSWAVPTGTTYGLSGTIDGNTFVVTLGAENTGATATVPEATNETAGLMTAEMVSKLAGIDSEANKYALPTASTTLGGVKTTSDVNDTSGLIASPIIDGVVYYKDTTYTAGTGLSLSNGTTFNIKTGYTTSGKNYQVQADDKGLYVNVPWTDTTYTAGTGLTLSGTEFYVSKENVSTMMNLLDTGPSEAKADDYLISQYAGGGTTYTTYYRRKVSSVVNSTVVKAALGTGDGTTKYLREDGTWVVPYSSFTGATSSAAGKAGLVPAPASGKTGLFLRSDGTWYDLIAIDNTTLDTFADLKEAWESADSELTTTLNNAIGEKAPKNHASTADTYGISTASKYGHAMASSTTPKALGTSAAVGSETAKFARGDHVHPLPALTDCTGTLTVEKGGTGANSFTANYILMGNGTNAIKTESAHFLYRAGTTSTQGFEELRIGNNIASGTAGNRFGRLSLYSTNTGGIYLTAANATAWDATNTLPNTSGTILNTGTTSWTGQDATTAKIGTLKINGTDNELYDMMLSTRGKHLSATDITDINTIKAPSIYYSGDSAETSGLTNSPQLAASGYRLMTFNGYASGNSYGWQLAAASQKIYWRTLGNGNSNPSVWYSWIRFEYGTQVGSSTTPIYLSDIGVPTQCATYAGGTKVTLNNTDKGASDVTIYAPTVGGTSGQYLKAAGTTSAPTWTSFGNLTLKTTNTAGTTSSIGTYNPSTESTLTVTAENLLPTYESTHTSQLNAGQWTTVTTPKGANNAAMENGTYIIQVSTHGGEFYSGVMSWTKTTTVHSTIQYDEVVMHNAGTNPGYTHIGVRVYRDAATPKLQLCSLGTDAVSASTAAPITIKMRRII